MITKIQFITLISSQQKFTESLNRIDKAISGLKYPSFIFECDWYNIESDIFNMCLNAYLTDEGVDTVHWWLYEDVDKIIYTDEKSIPVRTLGQLWEFFNMEPKVYFKSV